MTFIYDIVNLEFVVAVSLSVVAYYLRSEPVKVFILFGHILVIFLLNDILFSPSYFGDQFRQVYLAKTLRNGWIYLEPLINISVGQFNVYGPKLVYSSLVYSLFPFPFINSIQSIAMINFLIFLIVFVFIKKYNMSSNGVDYFYLLFPSLLLYSSLALRDMLVCLLLMIGIYVILIREKYILGLLLSSPLLIFKFQNYLMVVATLILFSYLNKAGFFRYVILGTFVVLASFIPEKIPIVADLYEILELWRAALFADQYMYDWTRIEQMKQFYVPLGTGFTLLFQMVKNFTYMLLKPLLWECDNPFQFIQSVENLVIFGMIIWINRKKIINEKIRQKILFLNCLLFVSMTINGLVVFNFGSAVRYKFSFIVVYFVFFLYLLKCDKEFMNQASALWSAETRMKTTLA